MRQLEIDQGGRAEVAGPSVNTLRRHMAAAQFLESHGIVAFPAGRPRVPAAAVEAVARISKRDPAYAQTLLADLIAGRQTVRGLRTQLENMPEQGLSPDPNIRKFTYEELQQALSKFASRVFGKPIAPEEFQLADFELGPEVVPVAMFDPLAHPYATGNFGDGRRIVVFDESTVRWNVSPDRAKREFKRNIAVATTMFDIVAVCCVTLQSDVDDMRARMYDECRKRLLVLSGVLSSEVGIISNHSCISNNSDGLERILHQGRDGGYSRRCRNWRRKNPRESLPLRQLLETACKFSKLLIYRGTQPPPVHKAGHMVSALERLSLPPPPSNDGRR